MALVLPWGRATPLRCIHLLAAHIRVAHHEVRIIRLQLWLASVHGIGFGVREVRLGMRLRGRADGRRSGADLDRLGLLEIEVILGGSLARVVELRV